MRSAAYVVVVFGVLIASAVAIADYRLRRNATGRLYDNGATIPYNKVGLLLGTPKYAEDTLLSSYTNRIDAAMELYYAGKIDQILVSSGNNDYYDHNCDSMWADLVAYGIPTRNILMDTGGTRTLFSIIRAKQAFHLNSFTVITQEQHSRRALYMADSKGLRAVAYLAKEPRSFNLRGKIREKLARFIMFYDLVVGTKP